MFKVYKEGREEKEAKILLNLKKKKEDNGFIACWMGTWQAFTPVMQQQ